MSGASSSDLWAAHRWTRDRVVEVLACRPDTAADATPQVRSGLVLGPVVALLITAAWLWGPDALEWLRTRLG